MCQQPEEGIQGKPTTHGEKEPKSCLKGGHGGTCKNFPCDWREMRAQSSLKTELAGGEGLTLRVFGGQLPVECGTCGDCRRLAATGKSRTPVGKAPMCSSGGCQWL